MQNIYYIKIKNKNVTNIKRVKRIRKEFKEYKSYDDLVKNYEIIKYLSFNENFTIYVKNYNLIDCFYCSFSINDTSIIETKNYYFMYREELEKNKK